MASPAGLSRRGVAASNGDSADVKPDPEDVSKTAKKETRHSNGLNLLKSWGPLLLLTVVSLYTHLKGIGLAKYVVWDEAHFGKFSNYYR
jgi:dolichyl-phosphate-mannose-protein mannosyltransferase